MKAVITALLCHVTEFPIPDPSSRGKGGKKQTPAEAAPQERPALDGSPKRGLAGRVAVSLLGVVLLMTFLKQKTAASSSSPPSSRAELEVLGSAPPLRAAASLRPSKEPSGDRVRCSSYGTAALPAGFPRCQWCGRRGHLLRAPSLLCWDGRSPGAAAHHAGPGLRSQTNRAPGVRARLRSPLSPASLGRSLLDQGESVGFRAPLGSLWMRPH